MVRKRKWGVIPSWTSPDKSPDKETIESFTILTTEANGFLSDIHDRMPLILPKESWDFWLDSEITSAEPYQQLLKPWEGAPLQWTPMSPKLNSSRNEGEAIFEKIGEPVLQED